ncbi:MAG: NUDIX hydrolase [Rhodothermales bacterium]
MLLFYCADEAHLSTIRRHGLRQPEEGALLLWTSLEAAQAVCESVILVVDSDGLPEAHSTYPEAADQEGRVRVGAVPPEAFRNLDPYLPPRPVVAGGGYVARPRTGEPDVLLIFRRGVWDLPKGKRDEGETIEACALREVREEIGIDTLHLVRALSPTVHGYERKGRYDVKTTYWFLMQTPETHFTPQAKEGIEAVAWTPWSEAVEKIGYGTLCDHMRRVEGTVREEMSA